MAFAFRNQPLKTLYTVYTVLGLVFIRLPYWVVVSSVPALRPKRTWTMSRALQVRFLQTYFDFLYQVGFPPVDPAKDKDSAESLYQVWIDGVPIDVIRGEIAEMARINNVRPERLSGYWYGKIGTNQEYGSPATSGEKVLYYMHGGGYVSGSACEELYATVINGILLNCAGLVPRAFGIEYRLTRAAPFEPSAPFPAALIDALAGYRYLVETVGFAPQDIIVGGDSAGAHLVLNSVRYLVSEKLPCLSSPGGAILLHPTADWAGTHDNDQSSSMARNYHSDYVYTILKSGYTARGLLGSLPDENLHTNPWLSPASLQIRASGLFTDFPPTVMVAGGMEQTLDPMHTLRDRLVDDNGQANVTYFEYPDAFHDFLCFPSYEPERSQALRDLQVWIEGVCTH